MTPDIDARMRQWRRQLHQHPETAFAEHRTADYIADVLSGLGYEVERGVGGTGVIGSLTRGTSTRAVGLRADMDGLPIQETDGRDHGSRTPGTMHACGHDGHMAMVLGAAALLADDPVLDGTVRVIFQPAEEPGRGAQAMIDDGLFDRFPVDALYGLHNLPGRPAGQIHTRVGPIMASEDNFTITITGRGGHAARPEAVIDPLVIGAELVLALQTVVARNVDPVRNAVLSCTGFEADGARNAIPSTVRITGDTRSFDPDVQVLLERRIRQLSEGIVAAHGATCTVTYTHEFAPTVNDPECTRLAADAATEVVGVSGVSVNSDPMMGSEDFGVFARHVPACFSFIGNGEAGGVGGTPLHSGQYDFNDEILGVGAEFYVAVVRRQLHA